MSADAGFAPRVLPSPPGSAAYVAIEKPVGRAVHGPGGLLGPLRQALGEDLHLVHRLDRDTSGVLLLARGKDALRAALAAWGVDVSKVYVATTRGVPSPASGAIELRLLEHRSGKPELLARALKAAYGPSRAGHLLSGRRVGAIQPAPPPGRTAVHPGGRAALTEYTVLDVLEGGNARVELRPREGRMHQLRVHLAAIGTPVLGDPFYDPAASPGDPRPHLHLSRLVWRDPPGAEPGTTWVWESPG